MYLKLQYSIRPKIRRLPGYLMSSQIPDKFLKGMNESPSSGTGCIGPRASNRRGGFSSKTLTPITLRTSEDLRDFQHWIDQKRRHQKDKVFLSLLRNDQEQ